MSTPDLWLARCDQCPWEGDHPVSREEADAQLGRHMMRAHSPAAAGQTLEFQLDSGDVPRLPEVGDPLLVRYTDGTCETLYVTKAEPTEDGVALQFGSEKPEEPRP